MRIKYPLAKETINEDDIDALCDWLKKYPRLTKGELTPQLEKEWADFIGTKYSVLCKPINGLYCIVSRQNKK